MIYLKNLCKIWPIFILVLLLSFNPASSQGLVVKLVDSVIVHHGNIEDLPQIASTLINLLPKKRIYLMNELHWVRMNNLIRNDLVKLFNQNKEVNCFLMEINHSYAFGMNLFLKYGDTKILADFDGYDPSSKVDTAKYYERIKSLYQYNLKQSENNKIRYVGIDFEMQRNRSKEYILAISYFLKIGDEKLPLPIIEILKEMKNTDNGNIKSLIAQNDKLIIATEKYSKEIAIALDDLFVDYLLIINAPNKIPPGRRDSDLMNTLNFAVKVLQETGSVKEPVFMGSFGKAHIFPEDSGSFSSLVQEAAYFKKKTSLIGVQYINCISKFGSNPPKSIVNDGLSIKNKEKAINNYLKQVSEKFKSPIVLLDNLKQSNFEYFNNYDAILIYTGV